MPITFEPIEKKEETAIDFEPIVPEVSPEKKSIIRQTESFVSGALKSIFPGDLSRGFLSDLLSGKAGARMVPGVAEYAEKVEWPQVRTPEQIEESEKTYPKTAITGRVVGEVSTALAMLPYFKLGAYPVKVAAEKALTRTLTGAMAKQMYPKTINAVLHGVHAAQTFGSYRASRYLYRQALLGKDIDGKSFLKEYGKGVAFGGSLGPVSQIPSVPLRIFSAGGVFGGSAAVDTLIDNGVIRGKDLPEIALWTALGAAFEAIGARSAVKRLKGKELQTFLKGKARAMALDNWEGHAGRKGEAAKLIKQGWSKDEYINFMYDLMYGKGISITPRTAIVDVLKVMPSNFAKLPAGQKTQLLDRLMASIKEGKSAPDAMKSAAKAMKLPKISSEELNLAVKSAVEIEATRAESDINLVVSDEEIKKMSVDQLEFQRGKIVAAWDNLPDDPELKTEVGNNLIKIEDAITARGAIPLETEIEGFEGKVEIPVANAVRELFDEGLVSSGFHKKLNRKWTLVFKGRVSAEVQKAARDAGLNVSFRIAPVGSDQVLTDIWASSIKEFEFDKATAIFNKFAKNFNPEAVLQEFAMPTVISAGKPVALAVDRAFFEETKAEAQKTIKELGRKLEKGEVITAGTIGDYITDERYRKFFAPILDMEVQFVVLPEKVRGQFGIAEDGTRQIQLNINIPMAELDNTFAEEMIHAMQDIKGRLDKRTREITEELAKKGAKALTGKEPLPFVGFEKLEVKEKPADVIKEIHTIDVKTYNPLALSFRKKIPLGTTMGSKVAHAKYYTTLFRNSIKGILKAHKKVTDVFGRSATLARIIDTIKPSGININVNDLDSQVIGHQKFVKSAPTGVLKGYTKTREELLSLLARKSGFSKEAFYTASAFRRNANTIPIKEREVILKELPRLANEFFRKIIVDIKVIDSADKSGKFLFLQRNSVRGTGKNQGFFQADGYLKGIGLSPLAKPEVESGIRSHSEFLNKKSVKLSSVDAFKVIDSADKSDFLLIDPPYYQEAGYAVGWSPDQTIRLINALDEAHKRGVEFTYHDTYNDTLVNLWESKGYKVFKIRVPSAFGVGAATKDELFVISSTVAPSEKPVSFEERQIGVLAPEEGVWGAKPAAKVERFVGKVKLKMQQKKLARALLAQAREMETESKTMERDIKDLGGIRAYKEGVEAEEYRVIPKELRRKDGHALDEMADLLNSRGYNFDDGEHLRAAIQGLMVSKKLVIADFMDEAGAILESKEADILKAELTKPRPSKSLIARLTKEVRIKRVTPYTLSKIIKAATVKGRREPLGSEDIRTIMGVIETAIIRRGKMVLPKAAKFEPKEVMTSAQRNTIEETMTDLKLPFNNMDTLADIKGFDPASMTSWQADELIDTLGELAKLKTPAERIAAIVQIKPVLEDKTLSSEYDAILARENKKRQRLFDKAEKRIEEGKEPRGKSPLEQSLRLSKTQTIKDVRYTLGDLEVNSSFPFYSAHYLDCMSASNQKDIEAERLFNVLKAEIEGTIPFDEQGDITAYYNAKHLKKPLPTLSANGRQLVENITNIMESKKSFVKKYRFMSWVESKAANENVDKETGVPQGFSDIPDVSQETLEEGYLVWLRGENVDAWLKEQSFGVVKKDYVPRALLTGRAKFPLYQIGSFTKKMMQPRLNKTDISDIPLLTRVKRYINNILNLEYLEKPVAKLDGDIKTLYFHKDIPGHTVELIQSWTDKMKGYTKTTSTANQILRGSQRWLHRTITVKPRLWFRNLFQRDITPPFKVPRLNPKTRFKRLKHMSQREVDFFYKEVNQFEAMRREYMYFLSGTGQQELITKIPGGEMYVDLAEKIGGIHPLSDMWNRDGVYCPTVSYVSSYIKKYKSGEIGLSKLKSNTAYLLMKTYEQRHFIKLLDSDPEKLAMWIGKWNSDNSQWMYKMKERSLEELSSKTPAFYNLFVWSKSISQLTGNLLNKIVAKDNTWQERRAGVVSFIGLVLAFHLGQKILNKAYGKYKASRYGGYDFIQSLLWQFGGATISEINESIDIFGELVFAYQSGDKKQKNRASGKALKQLDSVSNLFLPFVDPTLGLLETLTDREYISPFRDLVRKKQKHINRSGFEMLQHLLFRQVRGRKKEGRL